MIKKVFRWVFSKELKDLETQVELAKSSLIVYERKVQEVENLLGNIDVSVDIHTRSNSWACISIQGEETDYIKFVDLGKSDIREIANFLRYFERSEANIKVDAFPPISRGFFKVYNKDRNKE